MRCILLRTSQILSKDQLLAGRLVRRFLNIIPLLRVAFRLTVPSGLGLILSRPNVPRIPIRLILYLRRLFYRNSILPCLNAQSAMFYRRSISSITLIQVIVRGAYCLRRPITLRARVLQRQAILQISSILLCGIMKLLLRYNLTFKYHRAIIVRARSATITV